MDTNNDKRRQLDVDDAIGQTERDLRSVWRELRARLRSIDRALVELSPYRWNQAVEAAMTVATNEGPRKACALAPADLAGKNGWSIDQWRAALEDAKAIGLIRARRTYQDGKRSYDGLSLDREGVDELVEATRARSARRPGQPPTAPTSSDQVRPSPTNSEQLRTTPNTYKEQVPIPVPHSQSSSPEARSSLPLSVPGAPSDEWGPVEEELFYRCGMDQARSVARRLRNGAATPDEIRAVIAWWRPRRTAWAPYGVQKLFWRLLRHEPGQAPGDGWPPAKAGWVDPDAAAARQSEAARQAAAAVLARQAADQAAAAAATIAAELEATWGPRLDALDDEAWVALLADNEGQAAFYRKAMRRGGRARVRGLALEKLAQREAQEATP